jgi:putative ABC transport system ATP-binding protein
MWRVVLLPVLQQVQAQLLPARLLSIAAASAAATGYTLLARGVRRTYTPPGGVAIEAVRGVDLDLASGSITALTGPSGSGKSTLLHVLGGMDRPDEGSVLVDGEDLSGASSQRLAAYRRTVGFVFQQFALLPALTAQDNVLLPVLPFGVGKAEISRADELLASVGLRGRNDSLPHQLSGGQRQRVAIARALMAHPRLILADEPTGNLDSTTGSEIVDLLLDLRERSGVTMVLGTHDLTVAGRCDQVLHLRDGQLVEADGRR